MTVLEGPEYQAARDRIKGNPVISMMAAGVVTVPLAQNWRTKTGRPAPIS